MQIKHLVCTDDTCAKLFRDENGRCSRAAGCPKAAVFVGTIQDYKEFKRTGINMARIRSALSVLRVAADNAEDADAEEPKQNGIMVISTRRVKNRDGSAQTASKPIKKRGRPRRQIERVSGSGDSAVFADINIAAKETGITVKSIYTSMCRCQQVKGFMWRWV